ncbi:MAG: type II restriction endonuclease [Deltaproteobacteria bacterium]|nr:type II restriction endonuclease [Deltaproteobacteria bacterium]
MKYLKIYDELLKCGDPSSVFRYIIDNLKPSLLVWSYFVNWDKVFGNVKEVEVNLNILNYLIGKSDFEKELEYLLKKHPTVISTIPLLVVRDGANTKSFSILADYSKKKFVYEEYNFSTEAITDNDIQKIVTFVDKSGLKKLFVEKKIKSVVDYVIGVEAGLDSNARKNRSGHAMEEVVEFFVDDVCKRRDLTYLKEANATEIASRFGIDIPVDKSSRRYDFVIKTSKGLYIVETNYYSGGGSKLKATAGEYKVLHNTLKTAGYKFIWITDGLGWKTTHLPLLETFNNNDYLLSLTMLENGILDRIVTDDL